MLLFIINIIPAFLCIHHKRLIKFRMNLKHSNVKLLQTVLLFFKNDLTT